MASVARIAITIDIARPHNNFIFIYDLIAFNSWYKNAFSWYVINAIKSQNI